MTDLKKRPIIGITMGDPVGVGPEITVKALLSPAVNRICFPLVIGDASVIARISSILGVDRSAFQVKKAGEPLLAVSSPEILQIGNLPDTHALWGRPNHLSSKACLGYINAAIDLCMAGTIQGMTTAPVNKGELLKAGCRFTGHTELLAQRTGAEEYAMMLTAGDFKVVLVTTHVALKDVPSQIKKDRIQSILKLIHKSMPRFGISRPRIGVAALNPHSGEGGMMGIEESREIQPAIEAAQAEGILARGPFPADTLYTLPGRGEYDVFLAMYHDQGLIPLKSGAFLSSVNITLGLPIIRTSVDHGTAYDIAGRGVADPSSLINAIMLAAKLAAER